MRTRTHPGCDPILWEACIAANARKILQLLWELPSHCAHTA